MDKYGVPKKINRHVLKALYLKNEDRDEGVDFGEIRDLVEISMKNNVPVRDLSGAVRQSLQNMAQLGVIGRNGSRYCVRKLKRKPFTPKRVNPRLFCGINRNGWNDKSRLDPNLRKRGVSDDSLSGSEITKTRKLFSPVKSLRRKGQNVLLPKARMSLLNLNMNADFELDENSNEMSFDIEEMSDAEMDHLPTQSQQSYENEEKSEENKNENKEEAKEVNQNMNSKEERPLMPRGKLPSKEVITTEQNVNEVLTEQAICNKDTQPVASE